mmetsp:Transcript_7600/g.11407  ORF Transcript_7600/g.11407 Transcript_7600/m.11407 type:complete len:1060 (+) Transcript_7600:42-3221(+)|eukprot:CAMPEP_0197318312 /NCGR_PEP_ID=MMETSP0891-20130614/50482_1 /TAXON_ID=44058 ORGANISM="Aureoumbra lagunensis, Strain CCMP1510" /NCGR_SAMPLE_ID=MMETSP0891 /ASSEMBLY_ACC=CAM_ASM_000534 /LENGTH=1059 /DNA_ID=CAMNT_0042808693 /DNA_START=49 /DNA_END=3228 /DNA_ORIENTATION=+
MRSPSSCLVLLGSVFGLRSSVSKKNGMMRSNKKTFALISSGLAVGGLSRFLTTRRWASAVLTELQAPSHPAFALIGTERVEELDAECYVYEHEKTKAQVMSVVAAEENKVFGVVFRTPPADSTGLPHILEHSVLCGSEKFPTKEPFVELLKGSLQTFLNAFTYPDRTCYPVASQNEKDLRNLATVYLDAVFKPRAVLDPYVLKQEGWHFEVDKENKLEYKGVVYNEMKGVYSNPEALLNRAAQQALFPDNTYAVDSGGDPIKIPELTFKDFTNFHSKYYTPSNAKIFFYGDDDPLERLNFLDSYLSELPASVSVSTDTKVAMQPLSIITPRYEQHPFPSAESQHMISINWLLTDKQLKPHEELALALLDHLLVGTPSSTLRKALTDSGLGESVLGGGLSDELIQPTFTMGLKGVKAQDVAKVEPLILDTLQTVINNGGFDQDDVASSLNTIEFQLREFNTGSFPKGLSFMLGVMRNWIYERDPVEAVRFEEPLADLKSNLKNNQNYLPQLIDTYLISNTHRVSIEMVPDAEMEARETAAEAARLQALREEMDETQLQKVKEEMQILQERQAQADSPQALATIPTLDVRADIEPKVKSIPRQVQKLSDHTTLLTRTLPTAGILYADLALDLRSVLDPISEIPLVPLFTRMLTETGTSEYDAVALRRAIGAQTGGLSASALATMRVSHVISNPEDIVYRLIIRGKCTKDKSQNLFNLMTAILTDANFKNSKQRVIEMLKETKAAYESSFRTSGQQYAAARIGASLTRAGYIAEKSSGVSHYYAVLDAIESAQSNWPDFLARLESMRTRILQHCDLVINLTGDEATLHAAPVEALRTQLEASALENKFDAQDWAQIAPLEKATENEGYAVPTQVNYVAKGGRFYPVGYSPRGQDAVIRRVLSLDYLWNRVRVMGGAYGGSCNVNPTTGTFIFSSYRDPNLEQTLTTYDHAVKYLNELAIDQTELDKAIIATIGELDNPLTNDQKGFVSLRHYLDGTTDEVRQKWRDEVLATSKADFIKFADELNTMLKHNAKAVVFASAASLEAASSSLPEHNQLKITTLIN